MNDTIIKNKTVYESKRFYIIFNLNLRDYKIPSNGL